MIELPYKLAIELVETDIFRNYEAVAQVILLEDKVMYEAIGRSDVYDSDDYLKPPENRPYYLRQSFKKEYISGVDVQSCYYDETKKTIYTVKISIVGSVDDVLIGFNERREALSFYKTVSEWIF